MSCKGDGKPDRVGPGLVGGDTAVVVCSGLGAGFRIDLELEFGDGVGSGLLGVWAWVPRGRVCTLPMVGLSW